MSDSKSKNNFKYVQLGSVAMQPMKIRTREGSIFSDRPISPPPKRHESEPVIKKIPSKTTATPPPSSINSTPPPPAASTKVPDRTHLTESLSLLHSTIKQFVPDCGTSDDWVAEFELYCKDEEKPNPVLFEEFCALVYSRTRIGKGNPGHIAVSSCCTYLRYVTLKYKRFAHLPCFKAIQTEAGSIGSLKKAPAADSELIEILKNWFAAGPAEDVIARGGAYLQTISGGRPIDVKRLRGGGMVFSGRDIRSIDWRWTKSIKKAKDAKTVFPPEEIFQKLGPPPFTPEQWKKWGGRDGLLFPFADYTSDLVNMHLKELSKGFSEKLLSTSLRNIYHEVLGVTCENDAAKMARFTPHKGCKSLQSSYMSGRKVSTRCPVRASKKAPAKPAKRVSRRGA